MPGGDGICGGLGGALGGRMLAQIWQHSWYESTVRPNVGTPVWTLRPIVYWLICAVAVPPSHRSNLVPLA